MCCQRTPRATSIGPQDLLCSPGTALLSSGPLRRTNVPGRRRRRPGEKRRGVWLQPPRRKRTVKRDRKPGAKPVRTDGSTVKRDRKSFDTVKRDRKKLVSYCQTRQKIPLNETELPPRILSNEAEDTVKRDRIAFASPSLPGAIGVHNT